MFIRMNDTMPNDPMDEIATQVPAAILLDGLLQSFLLGLILSQATLYWHDYHDDSWKKRLFVGVIVTLSVLQTILEDYKVWHVTISQKPWSSSPIGWTDLFVNGLICSLCECFYIQRCWKVTNKNAWLLFSLSFLALTIVTANIFLAVTVQVAARTLGVTNDPLNASRDLLPSTIISFSYWIFGSLILDGTMTTILIASLWRSRIGLREVDQIITRIINITWETAALPSLIMLVAVALYHASPRAKDHLVLFFVLLTGKLYSLGLLRTLNSRNRLRVQMKTTRGLLGRTSISDSTEECPWVDTNLASHPYEPPRTLDALGSTSTSHFSDTDQMSSLLTRIDDNSSPPSVTCRIGEQNGAVRFGTPAMDTRERGLFKNRSMI